MITEDFEYKDKKYHIEYRIGWCSETKAFAHFCNFNGRKIQGKNLLDLAIKLQEEMDRIDK
jgi:hypothetical protein